MSKLVNWYRYYNDEITWFLIGFLFYAGLDDLTEGNTVLACVDFLLVILNYKFYRHES